MDLTPSTIGRTVRLRTGQGDTYAEGVVYAYCEAPQVAIETADGERIWWRADLADRVEGEGE